VDGVSAHISEAASGMILVIPALKPSYTASGSPLSNFVLRYLEISPSFGLSGVVRLTEISSDFLPHAGLLRLRPPVC